MSATAAISGQAGAPGANGVITFTGTAAAGATVEIAQDIAGSTIGIGWATADSTGAFQFATPAAALGYGTIALTASALDATGTPTGWSPAFTLANADPEIGLPHLGADLAAKLAQDAAEGLDATADLQALANEITGHGGGPAVLDIPAGTYIISSTILLQSNTFIDAPGVTLEASDNWVRPSPSTTAGSILGYSMIANADYASNTVQDQNIQIRGMSFNWNGYNNFGSAAIRFRSAENVVVQDAHFTGGEDGTAFMNVNGGVVNDSTAVGTVNYAFDNWEGPTNTVIENSTATIARFGGISLTGQGTSASDNMTGTNDSIIDNTIIGADTFGIDIDALSAGSAVNHVFVSGNTVDGPGIGMELIGPSNGAILQGNSLSGSMGAAEILVSNLIPGPASAAGLQVQNLLISGNTISNATIAGVATAPIVVQAANATVADNTVAFGSAPYDLWLAGNAMFSTGNTLDNWQSAAVLTAWSGSVTSTDAAGAPAAGQLIPIISGATLTVSGAGTLDLRSQPPLSGITTLQLQEAVGETVYLQAGAGVQVLTTGAAAPSGGPAIGYGAAGAANSLTIYGAAAPDSIDLGTGNDVVVLGGAQETVRGGGGNDTFYISAATAAATIDGGSGASQLVITGGGTVTLGNGITGIATVKNASIVPTTLILNALPNLTAVASNLGDTLIAGAAGQTLVAGLGIDTLVGAPGGGDTFAGRAAELEGDAIENFTAGDTIDVTSVGFATGGYSVNYNSATNTTEVYVFDGFDGTAITVQGSLDGTRLHLLPDALHGVDLVFTPGIYTAARQPGLTDVFGRISVGGADATDGSTDTLEIGGAQPVGGTLSLTADLAPITLPAGASLLIDGAGRTLDGGGYQGLTVASGNVTVENLALVGAGNAISLLPGAGTVALNAPASFTGGVTIGGGTLDLGATGAAGLGAIAFTTTGATLRIEAGVGVANTITGLTQGDTIYAAGIVDGSASLDPVTDMLTITGSTGELQLQLDAAATGKTFTTDNTPAGATVLQVACYCTGTRIRTPSGERAIEALRTGDAVSTRAGRAPIKWIGRRSYTAPQVAANAQLRPVRIRAGALAQGVPRRDLLVSPAHAVLVDGFLIPAGVLVNGVSILREPARAVAYLHIELATHDLIFAEHALAETYVDQAGRDLFDNAAEYDALYPEERAFMFAPAAPGTYATAN